MCNRDECVLVDGPYMNTAPLRKGVPATILGDFARRYHVQAAPIVSPVWGWSATNAVANSNHLAGTALDINAPQWPWGYRNMPTDLINRINALLGFYEGAVFWGRNWSRADEMHFQMGWREGDSRYGRILAKIGGTSVPTPSIPPGIYAQRGSRGAHVLKLQQFFNRVFRSYSRLAEDADFGPKTESVVKEFQKRVGIARDGVVGPVTLSNLQRYGYKP
jgi:peptidoglycan hydrolase-like protein with peptidoglycan-binding domain